MTRPAITPPPRAPSGRRSRAKHVRDDDPRQTVMAQRAALAAAEGICVAETSNLLDNRFASSLGRLRLSEAVSEEQYSAGLYVADTTRRYLAAIGAPRADMYSASGFDEHLTAEQCRARREAYNELQWVLEGCGDPDAAHETMKVCADDAPCRRPTALRKGLDAVERLLTKKSR